MHFCNAILLENNPFSLFQDRVKKNSAYPISTRWRSRTILFSGWILSGAGIWIQANSDKKHVFDLHWPQSSSAVWPNTLPSEGKSLQIMARWELWADQRAGEQKWELLWRAWLVESKVQAEEMKLQREGVAGAPEDWVTHPDRCAWQLFGSYLPSLVTDSSPSFLKHSKSLHGSKIQQKPVNTRDWLRYFLSFHIQSTKISLAL